MFCWPSFWHRGCSCTKIKTWGDDFFNVMIWSSLSYHHIIMSYLCHFLKLFFKKVDLKHWLYNIISSFCQFFGGKNSFDNQSCFFFTVVWQRYNKSTSCRSPNVLSWDQNRNAEASMENWCEMTWQNLLSNQSIVFSRWNGVQKIGNLGNRMRAVKEEEEEDKEDKYFLTEKLMCIFLAACNGSSETRCVWMLRLLYRYFTTVDRKERPAHCIGPSDFHLQISCANQPKTRALGLRGFKIEVEYDADWTQESEGSSKRAV